MWTVLFAFAVIVALAFALFWRPSDFVIRVRNGHVEYKGKLPRVHHAAIAQFLLHDLRLDKPVKILGTRQGRHLRLTVRGGISEGDRQRIRNFLSSVGL